MHSLILSLAAVVACASAACTNTAQAKCVSTPATSQRVRRDIHDLTATEWQNVVDALWIMKSTDMAAGVSKYGNHFKTSDYFVAKHAVAALDSRGDQGHYTSGTFTFHAAVLLEFENALLAINPAVEALPY